MACCGDCGCGEMEPTPEEPEAPKDCSSKKARRLRPSLAELMAKQKEFAMADPDECRQGIMQRFIWTTTYREMNKDGAARPLAVREDPGPSEERPPGDPLRRRDELAPESLMSLGEVFEKWDRPQVRRMAGRCDTMYNRPPLGHDAYFQEQILCREKYARCPEGHDLPTKENLELAKKNMLRQVYDKMIPGYGGYECFVTPPVCKVKKMMDPYNPYDPVTSYQHTFIFHPKEIYENPVKALKPSDLEKRMGVSNNPIWTLGKMPLPGTQRLSCYLECDWNECPRGHVPFEPRPCAIADETVKCRPQDPDEVTEPLPQPPCASCDNYNTCSTCS